MSRSHGSRSFKASLKVAVGVALTTTVALIAGAAEPFLPLEVNSSTIPSNGDLNPYGVAFVPAGFPRNGTLLPGEVLVSNFNNAANTQGTGTTIVRLDPHGALAPPGNAAVFFSSKRAGLSTALGVLKAGFVLVGNVPTTDGTFATIGAGALQVIDPRGNLLDTWVDPVFLDGPWDLAIDDQDATAHVFVSNVLNGTVTRLDVRATVSGLVLEAKVTVGTGYRHVPNAAALVLGPTGLAYEAASDTLYVASTADNVIYAIQSAAYRTSASGRGAAVFASPHLRGPLALSFAPNGDLLTANGDAVNADPLHPSTLVEFTRWGGFVRDFDVDASEGGAFGLAVAGLWQDAFDFAYIDDVTNSLIVQHLCREPPADVE